VIFYLQASDVFSLGCLFYYVLSEGKHPFGYGVQCLINLASGLNQIYYNDFKHTLVGNLGIIYQMITSDPDVRPSANVLLSHHIFWSNEKVHRYLQQVDASIKTHKEQGKMCLETLNTQPLYLSEINGGEKTLTSDWTSKLCLPLKTYISKCQLQSQ